MQIMQRIAKAILPIAILIPGIANAAVVYPALDIALFGDDSGAVLTPLGDDDFDFDIEATVFAIVVDGDPAIDIANQAFTLHGDFDSDTGTFYGDFNVAGSLLAGTFSDLSLSQTSSALSFNADLIYTSGTLMNDLDLPGYRRLEGTQFNDTAQLRAKLGQVAVVPVPAAAWLFGSGLLGLVGVARRKVV